MSRPVITSSAARGMPRSPSSVETNALVHDALGRKRGVLAMRDHQEVEYPRILHGPPHDGRAHDRFAVVGNRKTARGMQFPHLGQFLALRSLGDRRDGINPGWSCLLPGTG